MRLRFFNGGQNWNESQMRSAEQIIKHFSFNLLAFSNNLSITTAV